MQTPYFPDGTTCGRRRVGVKRGFCGAGIRQPGCRLALRRATEGVAFIWRCNTGGAEWPAWYCISAQCHAGGAERRATFWAAGAPIAPPLFSGQSLHGLDVQGLPTRILALRGGRWVFRRSTHSATQGKCSCERPAFRIGAAFLRRTLPRTSQANSPKAPSPRHRRRCGSRAAPGWRT